MYVQSLAYRSDLWFSRFEGVIHERDQYLAITTPTNPTFVWGNYLLFPKALDGAILANGGVCFNVRSGEPLNVTHEAFGWECGDATGPEIQLFVDAGFTIECGSVMLAHKVHLPAQFATHVVVKTLSDDHEWEQAIANQIDCRGEGFGRATYEIFKRNQFKCYRRMVDAGLGWWFGAFDGVQLIGDLGIFYDGQIGRFQNVGTQPAHRRQGVAGRLLYEASCYAFNNSGITTLVIVSEADSATERLYASVGFERKAYQFGLQKLQ